MRAARERQRWLAGLALMVAAPLPLTGIVSWSFVLPFVVVAGLVLVSPRPLQPLPNWVENLLALSILALVVTAGGIRYGVLRPVAQLAVLVAAVRLPGCGQRSRMALTGWVLGLVGVAGIASSTHPLLALYLLALLAFVVVAVGRLTAVSFGEDETGNRRGATWPPLSLVLGSVALAVVVAAPVFALLPRLRSPFAGAPLGGRAVTGFREAIALHGLGDIKLSHREVMRVSFPSVEPSRVSPDWLRLVGATMRRYGAGGWVEGRLRGELLTARAGEPLRLAEAGTGGGSRRVEIRLENDVSTLFVPLGAVSLEMPVGIAMLREPTGTLRTPRFMEAPLGYAVNFEPARVTQSPPDGRDLQLPPDSTRLRELAAKVTSGSTSRLAAALALEQHLQTSYQYSLASRAPVREDPVEWFLFHARAGHCEFFASSMVLLLRTLGIPARLQAGYAGGERAGESEFVIRESDAHAWVIAWVDVGPLARRAPGGAATTDSRGAEAAAIGAHLRGEDPWRAAASHHGAGWRVFDPTPPEARPGLGVTGLGHDLRFRWEQIEAAWDRWVLTFSLADQVEGVRRVLEAVSRNSGAALRWLVGLTGAALAAGGLAAWWRKRPKPVRSGVRPPAIARALERVMASALRAGLVVAPAMTPRQFAGVARAAFPAIGGPIGWLVRAHERSRYADGETPTSTQVRRAVRAIERAMRG